jgi:hypothetical protein
VSLIPSSQALVVTSPPDLAIIFQLLPDTHLLFVWPRPYQCLDSDLSHQPGMHNSSACGTPDAPLNPHVSVIMIPARS